ncbi:type VI secretion system-associated protein [Novosphingobium marinum]|uniref:Type VI secretion system protein ImpB n=1 Tax=Novosphingobium marinum TaxID=1514948 RepID=A0A7Y9XZP1_9SPHN|nr:type VI secretion system contractile sheath small subunit [Novosphingobium marinum]NYH96073.1 type VI secretion system protein ImpB [Novosphingobium marinum]GGC32232.1 type VI secretion system-associated protein [Novosphingobium marinum]
MAKSGQRFIKENRAPRVHIEYEVETFGSRQKVELPFVMGVMSDLSGKSHVEKKVLAERNLLEFDMDNFEERMAAIAPRAAFNVENTLAGDGGKMAVDLNFRSMEDFNPGAVAKNVPALKKLLDARQELNDLMLFMDGKDGAQDLLEKLMKDPDLLKSMTAAKAQSQEADSGADAAPEDETKE